MGDSFNKLPVRDISDLGGLGKRLKWQYFERLVAFVFEQNGFEVEAGAVRTFGGSKRQYDVIASNPRHTFAVDCKRWTGRGYRSTLLRKAAERQTERCMLLRQETDRPIIPMIVTLMQEDMLIHEGVPIVPLHKLNTFLNSWERHDEGIRRV